LCNDTPGVRVLAAQLYARGNGDSNGCVSIRTMKIPEGFNNGEIKRSSSSRASVTACQLRDSSFTIMTPGLLSSAH